MNTHSDLQRSLSTKLKLLITINWFAFRFVDHFEIRVSGIIQQIVMKS